MLTKERTTDKISDDIRFQIRSCQKGEFPWPLFLFGPAGVGKTCAALCLLDFVPFSEYWPFSKFTDHITAIRFGHVVNDGPHGGLENIPAFWRTIRHLDLLVLDELGVKESYTDKEKEYLNDLLDEREGRPLMLLSNVDLKGIQSAYGDRTVSRIRPGTVVDMTDFPDLRSER